MKKLQTAAALVAAIIFTSLQAHAVTQTGVSTGPGSSGDETIYDGNISGSDLLTGATITSNGVAANLGSYLGINDGTAMPGNNTTNNLYYGDGTAGTNLTLDPTVTFTLNTSVNTQGYTLSSVNSIYGWQNYQSMTDQSYTISYTTVTNATFTLLATVNYAPFDPANDNRTPAGDQYAASQVTLTDLGNITGVNAIQFTFTPYVSPGGVHQQGQMIREIDVDGVATVPEPSTWALMGLGALVLAWRLRRSSITS